LLGLRRFPFLIVGAAASFAVFGAARSATAVTNITTISQLQNISANMAGDYRLGADIDASATKTWNNGAGFIPLGANSSTPTSPTPFTGTLDGAGHKISNLTIASSGTSVFTALFAYVGAKGMVENVELVNANVTSSYQGLLNAQYFTGEVAALVAFNAGHIMKAAASGKVSLAGYDNIVAGLVAVSEGAIANSSSAVNVTGSAINTEFPGFAVAGLLGWNYADAKAKVRGSVTGSTETGKVLGYVSTNSGPGYTGGLVGLNGGTIAHSHSGGEAGCSGCWVGGLAGYNAGGAVIQASYSSAVVGSSINSRVGGLAGGNAEGGTISRSHATGSAASNGSNTAVGGLVGWNQGMVTLTWASGAVSGVTSSSSSADIGNLGGLVGYNDETGIIEKSYATGKVTDDVSGPPGGLTLGGLVGDNVGGPKGGRIVECYATGDVTGAGTGSESFVGGLVGSNTFSHANGSVENSYATGAVTGGQLSPAGAVIGESDDGNASFVYGVGRVSGGKGAYLGGVIGAVNPGGNVDADDYWDIGTTHRPKGAGRGSQAGLKGLSDMALKSGALPSGFDPSIWGAKAGVYPFLRALPAS
jgi:trimeric autotransporter adhesin